MTRPSIMRAAILLAGVSLFCEEVLGMHLWGETSMTSDHKEINPGHMDAADQNTNFGKVEGDEHIKNYYGVNIFNAELYAQETSQTKGT